MAAENEAQIWAVMAASGSGKGLWVKAKLRQLKPRRLVVWDFKREYSEFAEEAPTLGAVRDRMLKAGSAGPLRVSYRPQTLGDKGMRAEFEALCSLVQAWENCCFVAEELSNVTTPGWAPPAWRMMTTGGRHEGVHIIGVSQNPAQIDKQFLGNATLLHVGPLRQHAHRQAVEQSMDIEPGSLAELVKFQWVELDTDRRVFTTGVTVPPGVPKPPRPSVPTRRGSGAPKASQEAVRAATVAPSKPPRTRGTTPVRKGK